VIVALRHSLKIYIVKIARIDNVNGAQRKLGFWLILCAPFAIQSPTEKDPNSLLFGLGLASSVVFLADSSLSSSSTPLFLPITTKVLFEDPNGFLPRSMVPFVGLPVGTMTGSGLSIVGSEGLGRSENAGVGGAGTWNAEDAMKFSSSLSAGHGKYSHSFEGSLYTFSPSGHFSTWASHNTGSPFTPDPESPQLSRDHELLALQ